MNKQTIKTISFLSILLGSIVSQASPSQADTGASAYVYDPPSNVRQVPNGDLVCQVKQPQRIFLLVRAFYQGRFDGWYLTDACSPPGQPGTVWGVIHQSQIKITEQYSNLFLVDPIGFINCANNPSNVPESCASDYAIDN